MAASNNCVPDFFLLPLTTIILFGRLSPTLPIEWIVRLPGILTIVGHLIQLGVGGFIYLWSVRRERESIVAARANLVT
jgi:hypothetical protein